MGDRTTETTKIPEEFVNSDKPKKSKAKTKVEDDE